MTNHGFNATSTDDSDWETWFSTYARGGIAVFPTAFGGYRKWLADTVTVASLPANPSAQLYPQDFRPGNALVEDDQVSTILDRGQPMAAAPGLAVAKVGHLVTNWYVKDDALLRRASHAGYESVQPLPPVLRAY